MCKIKLDSIKKLIKHLKLQNNFGVFDKYTYLQAIAIQEFLSARRFEKHLLHNHLFDRCNCEKKIIHIFPKLVHVPNINLENKDKRQCR